MLQNDTILKTSKPAIDMFDQRCKLTQTLIQSVLVENCADFTRAQIAGHPTVNQIGQIASKIEQYYTQAANQIPDNPGLNIHLESDYTYSDLIDRIYAQMRSDQSTSLNKSTLLEIYSTRLLRALICIVLILQAGNTLSNQESSQLNLSDLDDFYDQARRLIWLDDWSTGHIPITIADLHQVSKPIAKFQQESFIRFFKSLKSQSSDDVFIDQTILRMGPPNWVKDRILRFARTPVLVQGFDIQGHRQ